MKSRFGKMNIKFTVIFFIILSFFKTYGIAQDFWHAANGPNENGSFGHFVFNSSRHIFVGSSSDGVFLSTDNGDNWKKLNINGGTRSMAINLNGDIYVGNERGLFRSIDNGVTWNWASVGLPYPNVSTLAINTSGDIYSGTDSLGIFLSYDNGDTWSQVSNGLPGYTERNIFTFYLIRTLVINSSGHVFAGTRGGGVYRSTDFGENWMAINVGLTEESIRALAINSNGDIYVGTEGKGIFRSSDNGENWSPTGLMNAVIHSLAIGSNGYIIATTNSGPFLSMNHGIDWIQINTGLTAWYLQHAWFNSLGHIFVGSQYGMLRSTDNGQNWQEINRGLSNFNVTSLKINDSGHIFAGGTLYRSTDNGDTWQRVPDSPYSLSLAINVQGHIFAGIGSSRISRSTDDGLSWTEINIASNYPALPPLNVNALAINSQGHVFVATHGGLFRSMDNGESWTRFISGMIFKDLYSIAFNSKGDVFVGSSFGAVNRSFDNGESWTQVSSDLTDSFVRSLAINSKDHIFAGSDGGGIYRSTDDGDSWTPINVSLTNLDVLALAITQDGNIFAGTESGGVFQSIDNGENWLPLNDGLTNLNVSALAINASGRVFAGTWGGGVFRSSATTSFVSETLSEIPADYMLEQNYPNPFNPSTTIKYTLVKEGFVTLKVFDLLGIKVKTLVKDKQTAGAYKVVWHPNNLASGVYFYRLQASQFLQQRKMLLLR